MKDIIAELSKPLTKEDIELRVGSNSAKSFTLLVYKTARTDIKRLNEVCPLWENYHRFDENKNNVCKISIWSESIKQWVSREDVGTGSNTEKEKGPYSDSFKRAGVRFGIGVELYSKELKNIRINWNMKANGTDKNGKAKYYPIDFWPNNLEISKYEVVDGKPSIEIKYDGRVIFPTGKKPPKNKFTPTLNCDSVSMGNKKADDDAIKVLRTQLENKQEFGDKDTKDRELWLCEQFNVDKMEDILGRECKEAWELIEAYGEPDNIPL